MEIGIDSFAANTLQNDSVNRAMSSSQLLAELLERMVYADEVGLDSSALDPEMIKEVLDTMRV